LHTVNLSRLHFVVVVVVAVVADSSIDTFVHLRIYQSVVFHLCACLGSDPRAIKCYGQGPTPDNKDNEQSS